MGEKFYYAAGPGDVAGTFAHWVDGKEDPHQFAITYSRQFFDLVARRNGEALVVSSHPREDKVEGKGIRVLNRGITSSAPRSNGKFSYWINECKKGLRLLADLINYRPDVAVIAEGTAPWIFTIPARWFGVKIVPALHCVLWPIGSTPNPILRKLDEIAFRLAVRECLCVSNEIIKQVDELTGGRVQGRLFYPSYESDQFDHYAPVNWNESQINLLYLGRLERDKGVFDLVEAFALARKKTNESLVLHFCGDGDAMEELETFVKAKDLQGQIQLHGHCQREVTDSRISEAHLIIVPTTSDFVEGFNKVVAEGVLAGRHVISTSVCPAAYVFGDAVTVVAPDSPSELSEAILTVTERMKADPSAHLSEDTGDSQKLLTSEMSWGSELENIITDASLERPVIGYLVPQFPSQTHAFFWRELSAMREQGAEVRLLSTRPPLGEECRHDFAEPAREETVYLSKLTPAALVRLLTRPAALIRGIRYILGLNETTVSKRFRALTFLPCAAQLAVIAERLRIGHVHLHSCADAGHIGALAHFFGGPEYSLTLHGDLSVYGTDHGSKFADARWVSTVTRPLQKQIVDKIGFSRSRIPVIWMGVDVEQFAPVDRSGEERGVVHLATIARIIPQKGHLHALEAIARVRADGHEVRYSIAGSGPFSDEVQAKIDELGLSDCVTMLGSISETQVRALLDEADVFMLPSYGLGEAAPVSVMEAMACGLPVICSRIGGTEDMIRHMEDGWLVHQQNEDDLTEAISRFASDKEFRLEIGNGARESALRYFDHRKNAGALLECIRGDAETIERASNAADTALAR